MEKITLTHTIKQGEQQDACALLSSHTHLSKGKVKDAMVKGAVWLQKQGGKQKRLRRSKTQLSPGDILSIYYDKNLLSRIPPTAQLVSDQQSYTIWNKPAGLLSQGSLYGDHCSLLRQAQLFYNHDREVFLVHRLDREASGLILIAHNREAAAKLSLLFVDNQIHKQYHVEVRGDLSSQGRHTTINFPLDGKDAVTEFVVKTFNPETLSSTAEVVLRTGRRHQIRRHFDMLGFPVLGDPAYGTNNKNSNGLKLTATALRFRCPFTKRPMVFELLPFE
jgi:tRNA pseudouridine32 synthase/23S rRNA pseudouridine746 synthase